MRFQKNPGSLNIAGLFTMNVSTTISRNETHDDDFKAECAPQLHATHAMTKAIGQIMSITQGQGNMTHCENLNWDG